MPTPRKIGDTVVSFTSRRGVNVFRLVMKRNGEDYITPRFQMRVQRGNRRVFFQLPTTVKEAGAEADKIDAFLDVRSNTLDMAIKLFDPERWEMKNPTAKVATVADILKAHEAAEKALSLNPLTADDYRTSLVRVIRQAKAHEGKALTDEAIKELPLTVLTHHLFSSYRVSRVEQAGADKGAQEKKKRAANRTLTFVRSLFSQAARRHYTHLVLPENLDEVLDSAIFRKVGKIRKRLPESEVLRRLFTEAGELRETDRNAYIAFLLAAHAGLRAKEIAGSRPDWITAGDPPRMWVKTTEDFIAKSYEERFAEVQPWVFDELSALVKKGETHLLMGTKEERTDLVFRRLNAWVKARGFAEAKGEKGVHGLRFLFGAYIANRRSHYTAQKFLGHESVKTTEDHYTDLMLDTSLYDLWENRPAWLKGP